MTKKALKLALEALKEAQTNDDGMEKWDRNKKAIIAIKEALAQPEQEPVAWMSDVGSVASAHEKKMGYVLESAFTIPLYTTPPQRIWVGLVFCIVRVVSEIESKGLKPIVEKIWYGPQKENNT